jgi:diadenosine tetraphosphate (Ap4A) HIT family hydrolase
MTTPAPAPSSEGHLLIVPRRHVPTWFDASADERAALMADRRNTARGKGA